jgi:hypothetical protein
VAIEAAFLSGVGVGDTLSIPEFGNMLVLHPKEKAYGYRQDGRNELLSSGAVNAAKATRQKPTSSAASAL